MKNEEQNTQRIILEAAENEFLAKGFDGARTVSIAEKAGVTHAMLHYYFRSKEQLYSTVLESKISVLFNAVKLSFDQADGSLIERIKNTISAHFDFLAQNPKLPPFILSEMGKSPEKFKELVSKHFPSMHDTLFATVATEIERGVRQGEIAEIEVFSLVFDIISLNLFPFIALQAMQAFKHIIPFDEEVFLASRKAENIELICSRLTKK